METTRRPRVPPSRRATATEFRWPDQGAKALRANLHKTGWLEKIRTSHQDLAALLDEIYAALQADSLRPATMGVRCVLDLLMRKEVGDRGSFERGLDALVASQSLSQLERTLLEASLDAGNAASHRSYKPGSENMARIMGTVEHLVERFYVLRPDAEELVKSTSPRPPRTVPSAPSIN